MENPKYTSCWEFNSEHSWKLFWCWRHYCNAIC